MAHKLSCPKACGILQNQGSNLCPWQPESRFLPTGPPGKPPLLLFGLVVSFDLTHTKSQTQFGGKLTTAS